MPLTIITGERGSGKTLFAVMIVEVSKRPIYSNFKIDYSGYVKLELETLLDLPSEIEFLGDEFYSLFDSRNSMSHVNVFGGYISFQLRKTLTNIYITMIQLGSIDLRYRMEWDYLVECKRVPNDNEDWHFWDFLYTIYNNRLGVVIPVMVLYEDAELYFDKFDTNEIIKPVNISRLEHAILVKKPKFLYQRGLEIYGDIIDDIKKKTKNGIKSALMRNGYDPIWSDVCFLILSDL